MNVLSLFDGISCGRLALERAGIKVKKYYSSEINKHAIRVAQNNYPETIQIGDAVGCSGSSNNRFLTWNKVCSQLTTIDLLIGGSPCQGFSSSGKQLNFKDPRSALFFEFVRLLKELKPKYFLLENVRMKQEYQDIISKYLKVEPIIINSSLVSAQNRVRLYWTNIPGIKQPRDRKIKLRDILEGVKMIHPGAIRGRRLNKATIIGRRLNEKGKRDDYNKKIPITQCLEVRHTNTDKSNCLTTVAKDNVLTTLQPGRYPDAFKKNLPFRYYTRNEYCRLQTIPENFFNDNISDNQVRSMIGNGWTIDVVSHILKNIKK